MTFDILLTEESQPMLKSLLPPSPNHRKKRFLASHSSRDDIMIYARSNKFKQPGGEIMRRLFAVGAILVTVGALIIIMSAWYHGVVAGEYANENPLDNSGPCEGMSQNVGTCNLLKSMESLWIPGWILIFVGSMVITVGATLWAIALRVPSQPQFQPISQSGKELCPFCVLSWLPEEQRDMCKNYRKSVAIGVQTPVG
jgi:hypothetical protein